MSTHRDDAPLVGAPYALGFRSAAREVEDCALPVSGALPAWLDGSLLRVAPAQFEVGGKSVAHWFDGLAMLHRFGFADGAVRYASRFLRSSAYVEAQRTGAIARGEFATDPCRTLFGRVMAILSPRATDNAVVSINRIGEEVVALTETRLPVRFDPRTLETLGVHDWGEGVDGATSTAHPHHDGTRAYTYLVAFGRRTAYHVHAIEPDGRERRLQTIPVDEPAYMHSFAMSERHLILAEFPLVVNPLKLYLGGRPFIRNFRWKPERGVTLTAIDKTTGAIAGTWRAPPFFAFHHVNAFETPEGFVVDLVAYDDARIIDDLYLARLRGPEPIEAVGRLTRLTLPLGGGTASRRLLSSTPIELPRIDYGRRAGRPYRFVWGTGVARPGDFIDSIVRIDLDGDPDANARVWAEDGAYPGEPVFVPRPGGTAEDDGVLLSVVLDSTAGRSYLLVLDAATLAEVARARTPDPITFGFHGNFVAEGDDGPLHA